MQASFHDHLEQEARQLQLQEQDETFQRRYESEQRDRKYIHRGLELGTPTQQLEGDLVLATEFVRLNPGRDVYAYVRGLIDEETSSFHALNAAAPLSDFTPPAPDAQPSASRGTEVLQPASALKSQAADRAETTEGAPHRAEPSNPRAQASEDAVRQYIQENFRPTDWLAVVVRNRETGETIQRMGTAQRIASSEFQSWLRYKNAHGSDIYLSLNTFKDHSRNRTKADLKDVRHVYLDLDEDGPRKLAAIHNDSSVPRPNYVLNTSPEKYQVIWKVEGIGEDDAEALLRSLAQRFASDPAATDSTRVFRVPGFSNKKYEHDFQVGITREAPANLVYHADDFRAHTPTVEHERHPSVSSAPRSARNDGGSSQSEKDYAYAIRKLRDHEDPEQIIRDMTRYRSADRYDKNDPKKLVAPKKANPRYYAEHTVGKAIAQLGMAARPPRSTSAQPDAGGTDLEPNR